MSSIEQRLQRIEDKMELEQVLENYYAAVDSKTDIDGIVACFTEDAKFDVSDLGLDIVTGHDAIRKFFVGVFADTKHHCHHVTNFRVKSLEENTATARGYVLAKAEGVAGTRLTVHCCYDITYVRTAQGWKMSVFDEDALMPIGEEMAELHNR